MSRYYIAILNRKSAFFQISPARMSAGDEKVADSGDPVDASGVALDTENNDVKLTHAKFAKNKDGDEEPAVVIATPLGKKDQVRLLVHTF